MKVSILLQLFATMGYADLTDIDTMSSFCIAALIFVLVLLLILIIAL